MYKLKFLAVLIALCVQGCSAGLSSLPSAEGLAQSGAVDGCSWVRPVYLSTEDVLTDETARQVLLLNETWERVCSDGSTDGTDQVQTQVQTKSEPIKP